MRPFISALTQTFMPVGVGVILGATGAGGKSFRALTIAMVVGTVLIVVGAVLDTRSRKTPEPVPPAPASPLDEPHRAESHLDGGSGDQDPQP